MSALVEALCREWLANGRRWEPLARLARGLGLEVWNPAIYAAKTHARFLDSFPPRTGALLALGLNPGPYGMAQTGIPFTDCRTAKRDLGFELELPGCAPADLAARLRKEGGGWRGTYERSSLVVYGFLRAAWGDLKTAYANWFVGNPCPLLFLDPQAWNVTPADSRLRKLPGMQSLREQAVENFHRLLGSRGVVLLGRDVAKAAGELADRLVGPGNVVRLEHPARAIPIKWAAELKAELMARKLL